MKKLLADAKQLNGKIVKDRRYFHQNPELGSDLPKTFKYVWECLEEMGYTPEKVGSSIVALVGQGEKTFLIRGDMDALPMEEDTGLEFSSIDKGKMHACGHDCHTAMLLGAAKLLKEREDILKGKVKIFFQAAEEILEGAKEAVGLGLLENPKVDAAMMIHILSNTSIKEGSLLFPTDGAAYASADWYKIDVVGKGGHGAMPENTISSINTICAINAGIQEIVSVGIPPSANVVVTVGEIHAGEVGSGNIIPNSAYLSGTIRTFDEEIRQTIKDKLEIMVEGITNSRGAKAKISYSHNAPAAIHDNNCRNISMEVVENLLGKEFVVDLNIVLGGKYNRVNGSEDFAYIAEKVPSAIMFLAAGTPENGYCYPAHNPKTDFDEDVFYVGSAAYTAVAMEWLNSYKDD